MPRSPEPAASLRATVFDALVNPPRVARTAAGTTCELRIPVDAAAEVMAGHYPGAPIMPGVLVVDVLAQLLPYLGPDTPGADAQGPDTPGSDASGPGTLRIAAIERVRYLNPLLPGDELRLTLTVTEDPATGRIVGVARGTRSDGSAANEVRLRLVRADA